MRSNTYGAPRFVLHGLVEPTTTSISPTSENDGDNGLTLTVNGTGFVARSVVRWGGVGRETTFVSSTQLTAVITAADLRVSGTFDVTVFNPPPGGGESNAQTFTVIENDNDPYFANVVLLLGFEGTDEAGSFVDSSAAPFSISNGSSTLHDTAQQKFGATSGRFPGAGGVGAGLVVNSSTGLTLGNSDFTIEGWVRFNGTTPIQSFFSEYSITDGDRAWSFALVTGPNIQFSYSTTGFDAAATNVQRSWSPSTGVWYHVAACRNGADLRMFVDGTQVGTTHNIGSATIDDSNVNWNIGAFFAISASATLVLNGWLDEWRVTVGVARYTANFTAPTAAFPRF